MEFGWWNTLIDQGKFQVHAIFHGGNLKWVRKQGHHTSWEPHLPTQDDWDRLIFEADKRYVRRLISPKQYQTIVSLKQKAGL